MLDRGLSARPVRSDRRLSCPGLLLGLAVAAGCSWGSHDPARPGFLPDPAEARGALRSVLEAWKNAPDPAATPEVPGVKFVDQHRKPGQKLVAYEVLGDVEVENARQFAARLELSGETEPALVRYNVFGINPTWVFRLEDYELISHWEHKMDDPPVPEAR